MKLPKNITSFEISGVNVNKFGRDKTTNVDLHWYEKDKFVALSKAEKWKLERCNKHLRVKPLLRMPKMLSFEIRVLSKRGQGRHLKILIRS